MIEKTLAKRYASALVVLAEKENVVERIESEILAIKDMYQKSVELRQVFGHPRISKLQKKSLVESIFKGKIHNLLQEFLNVLIEKGRIRFIVEIADSFDQLAYSSRGLVRVKVKAYSPLSKENVDTLNTKLTALMNKKLLLDVAEDKTLKGGLVVRIGDRVIDGSVAGRLKNLRERLYEVLQS